MSTPNANTTTSTAAHKQKRTRSPSYPSIGLKAALEKATAFYAKEGHHAAPLAAVAKDWEFEIKSSGLMLGVAALKKYGIFEEIGSDQSRQFKLTDLGLRLVVMHAEAPERAELLKKAALHPPLYRELWAKYGEALPSDATIKTFLILEKKFNRASVEDAIRVYKQTISFAKLSDSDTLGDSDENTDPQDDVAVPPTPSTHIGKLMPPAVPPLKQQVGMIDIPVPLPSGALAYYRVPARMNSADFAFYKTLLDAYKPGLVQPDAEPQE